MEHFKQGIPGVKHELKSLWESALYVHKRDHLKAGVGIGVYFGIVTCIFVPGRFVDPYCRLVAETIGYSTNTRKDIQAL